MASNRGTGHLPVPDPTSTYCTVPDCRRYISRQAPNEHMRGTGGRRRYGDPEPPRPPRMRRTRRDVVKLAGDAAAAAVATLPDQVALLEAQLKGVVATLLEIDQRFAKLDERVTMLEVAPPVVERVERVELPRNGGLPLPQSGATRELGIRLGLLEQRVERLASRP